MTRGRFAMARVDDAEAVSSRSPHQEDLYAMPRNLVLAASAGTGKTHALVGVIVHLLLGARAGGPVHPSRIVATTFSRKAAAEIRTRVFTEVERLAAGPSTSVYASGIRSLIGGRGSDADIAK